MSPRPEIAPGIYFDLPEDVYHAADGLSCSGMKHLSVSPLNYWHNNLNPAREPRKETTPQRFGKAAHCLGLEPHRFAARYALKLAPADFPGALVTADDMKAFLESHGLSKSGKTKQELADRIKASGLPALIWAEELERHAAKNEGKTLLGDEESALVQRAAQVLAADPYTSALLTGGMAEVSFFVRDPATGVMLKSRMDYVKPSATIDLKTFSNTRGKPTDRAIFDAIFYEAYFRQCVFYHQVREIARMLLAAGEIKTYGNVSEAWLSGFTENDRHTFGLVFIESDEPFDLRILQLARSETAQGEPNVYWHAAALQIEASIELYAECRDKYGDDPWRDPAVPRVLHDTDLPQLMFA